MAFNKYVDFHKEIDDVLFKKCIDCSEWKEAISNNFGKDKNTKSGFNSRCKLCQRKNNNRLYMKDREERIKKAYQRILDNYDDHLELLKKNNARPETKEKVRVGGRKYRRSDKYQDWKEENKDKFTEYRKNHRNHDITDEEWDNCKKYFSNCCAYCGLHKDKHYVLRKGQLKLFDLNKEHVDDNGANDLSNCIPSCSQCNSEKNTKSLDNWYNKDNPKFNQIRYEVIIKWLDDDYKKYIIK